MSIAAPDLNSKPGTKKRARQISDWLWERYSYKLDDGDTWSSLLAELKAAGIIAGDCEDWSRTLMGLLFHWGGFALADMADVVVDTDQTDDKPFDHHVAGIYIKGKWHYCHCWAPKILTVKQITTGQYIIPQGYRPQGVKMIEHRLLSEGQWYDGAPDPRR